jgi:glycosyltransferase involved in cell wall biosynthesis
MPTLRVEGLPFVLLEAMSCGKPVIASRIGGNTSVITDGDNGLLIEPGNVEQLIEKVQMIIRDGRLANRLSSSARKTISNHFSADQMIDGTLSLMEKVIR